MTIRSALRIKPNLIRFLPLGELKILETSPDALNNKLGEQ